MAFLGIAAATVEFVAVSIPSFIDMRTSGGGSCSRSGSSGSDGASSDSKALITESNGAGGALATLRVSLEAVRARSVFMVSTSIGIKRPIDSGVGDRCIRSRSRSPSAVRLWIPSRVGRVLWCCGKKPSMAARLRAQPLLCVNKRKQPASDVGSSGTCLQNWLCQANAEDGGTSGPYRHAVIADRRSMKPQPPVSGITGTRRQRSRATRAAGYTIAAVVNSALLYVLNVFPGWEAVPFATTRAAEVVPLLNAALTIGIVGNLLNVLADRRWVRALTEIVSSIVSLAFIIATWTVFPFSFDETSVSWGLITRVVLGFAAAGCVISVIVQVVALAIEARRASSTVSRPVSTPPVASDERAVG